MSDDGPKKIELGFVNNLGEPISFDQIAKGLPKEYPAIGEYDLPGKTERAIIKGMDRFYDFFQVIYVDEKRSLGRHHPNKIGWYWVTYFYPARFGFGTIGPFSDENRALSHACSHALPLNDSRRNKYKYGYIGSGIEICCSIPRLELFD